MPKSKVNDIEVHYEVDGEGQPLLLIGGLGSAVSLFARSIPIFSTPSTLKPCDRKKPSLSSMAQKD